MKKKAGFTLVEILIVIVIIGILSSVLLPRLSGYMARTRDTKRQMDLKNIAAAIEMYRDQKGEFPLRKDFLQDSLHRNYAGPVGGLSDALETYINKIPHDPIKKHSIKNLYSPCVNNPNFGHCHTYFKAGEYFFQSFIVDPSGKRQVVLIAKAETPDLANYVGEKGPIAIMKSLEFQSSAILYFNPLCSEIKKGSSIISPTLNTTKCVYTSQDQLYYVVKIE